MKPAMPETAGGYVKLTLDGVIFVCALGFGDKVNANVFPIQPLFLCPTLDRGFDLCKFASFEAVQNFRHDKAVIFGVGHINHDMDAVDAGR